MTTARLYLDIETGSDLELDEVGLYRYLESPRSRIIGFAYAFNDHDPVWVDCTDPVVRIPREIFVHIAKGAEVWIFNAEFDRNIWNALLPRVCGNIAPISIEQTRCVMAMARNQALPAGLEGFVASVGLKMRKDEEGYRIMKTLCRPKEAVTGPCPEKHRKKVCWRCNGTGQLVFAWHDDKELYRKLGVYACQDIHLLREGSWRVLPLSRTELEVYQVDQAMNDLGVKIDVELAKKANTVFEQETMRLDAEIVRLTNGIVKGGHCHVALKKWLISWGVPVDGVAQDDVEDALARDDLPPVCRQVLQARSDISNASLAKIPAFLRMVSGDGRLRGNQIYHGAGQTGRFNGRGAQLLNLKRPDLPAPLIKAAIQLLVDNTPDEWIKLVSIYYGNPLRVLANCLRGMLIPDKGFKGIRPVVPIHDEIVLEVDGRFIALDYAQVEARALALLAGHKSDLETFRNNGPIYELRAAKIFNLPVSAIGKSSKERHVGKETVLGSGFGMGHKKFHAYITGKGGRITLAEAKRAIDGWREDHPEVTGWWEALTDGAFEAIKNPGQRQKVRGGVTYWTSGSFLFCEIPSGRRICYPYPRLEEKTTPWGETKLTLTYNVWRKGQWVRDSTHGGKLAENIIQGYCRDLLCDALVRFQKTPPRGRTVKELEQFMAILPPWAEGMPMKVEGYEDDRYRK